MRGHESATRRSAMNSVLRCRKITVHATKKSTSISSTTPRANTS
jgi:hypothetical protein